MKKLFSIFLIIMTLTSCEAIFVEDISQETVELLAPSDNTSVNTGIINFNWNEVTEAEKYQLQIATPTFSNTSQIVLDTIISNSRFDIELSLGDYQWRVKAINSEYETSYSTNTFTVN